MIREPREIGSGWTAQLQLSGPGPTGPWVSPTTSQVPRTVVRCSTLEHGTTGSVNAQASTSVRSLLKVRCQRVMVFIMHVYYNDSIS